MNILCNFDFNRLVYSCHATRHFLGINIDWLLVSLRALSRNLTGGQICETTAVAVTGKRQALIPRPLLNDVGEAHRHLAATATDFKRCQRRNVFARQDKTNAIFISLHLHTCRCTTTCVDALTRHLRLDFVANFKQDAFDFVHNGVVDNVVVSNCHFLRVFSRFKPFFHFSNIIYQLSNKNRLEAIFRKNKTGHPTPCLHSALLHGGTPLIRALPVFPSYFDDDMLVHGIHHFE